MDTASYTSTQFDQKTLTVSQNVLTKKFTLANGILLAGAVLGAILGTPTAAAAAGNTGNGTIGTLSIGAGVKMGVYTLVCIEPVTNLGTFAVEDPDGVVIGRAIAGTAFAGAIGFTIADGATDFVAGDRFTVTVAPAVGNQVKLSVAAATDGSQIPMAILMHDADASLGAVECLAYTRGDFNSAAMNFGAGHTVDTVRAALEAKNMYITS